MSVSPGQAIKASIVNDAFMSRKNNTSTTGIIGLQNTGSGAVVSNLQQTVNDLLEADSLKDTAIDLIQQDVERIDALSLSNQEEINMLKGGFNTLNAFNPEVTDDRLSGFYVGAIWKNSITGKLFFCDDDTEGAAVWSEIETSGGLSEWAEGVAYEVGEHAVFDKVIYKVTTAHISSASFEGDAVNWIKGLNAQYIYDFSSSSVFGDSAEIATPTTKHLILDSATLNTVAKIGMGAQGQELIIINYTFKDIFLNHQNSASSLNWITTPDGRPYLMKHGHMAHLVYDSVTGGWTIVGSKGNPPEAVAEIPAVDINWRSGEAFYKAITANTTFTYSNIVEGKVITAVIENISVADVTIAFPAGYYHNAIDLVVPAGKVNIYTFIRANGRTYISFISGMGA